MTENYHKWYSQYLSREFEMLVFGTMGFPLVLFPAAGGRYFDLKDIGLIESAQSFIENECIKIYCPDSIDSESWYNYDIPPQDRVQMHMTYEKLVLHDIINFALFETDETSVALAGVDLGGYHAANIAFKYPDKVSNLICLDSIFNIKKFIMGHYDDNCYFNNPPDYLPGLTDNYYLEGIRSIEIIIKTRFNIGAVEESKALSDILHQKEIEHKLEIITENADQLTTWRKAFYDSLNNSSLCG